MLLAAASVSSTPPPGGRLLRAACCGCWLLQRRRACFFVARFRLSTKTATTYLAPACWLRGCRCWLLTASHVARQQQRRGHHADADARNRHSQAGGGRWL